ncbi:hypothetical protein [Scytonema millei]|uniref:Uncharacterized protein n=1 Tax=Scytonema millei VB511283 TaxID=1245923 RepID=A0A9X5E729_9CYAN|nr:hypothetical protein [Scytonema millei]NHC36427.1 hypothetical protein [Scytonema millei VB511283]
MLDNSSAASDDTGNNSDTLLGSPFDRFSESLELDGSSDIFGSSDSFDRNANDEDISPMSNDLLYGGNPFAGDNFWNIFADENNPNSGNFPDPIGSEWNFSGAATPSQILTISNDAIVVPHSDEYNNLLLNASQAQASLNTNSDSVIWL